MKLIFFGTSDFSKPVFEALKKNGYSPILWSLENPREDFKKMEPDICIVAAYGKIIPKEYLGVPKYGFLNIHPSLLPKYRGASPIQSVILNDDKETGVTIISMDEKVDHGKTVASIKYQVARDENYKSLEEKLAKLGAKLLIETLPKWMKGEIRPKEQDHSRATYIKKFSWPDGKIDWNKSVEEIDRQIRALNPEPGTWTTWNNKILKILDAEIYDAQPHHKHEQIYIGVVYEEKGSVFIPCSIGHIEPLKIQLEGKKPLSMKDFLNGHKDFIGSKLT